MTSILRSVFAAVAGLLLLAGGASADLYGPGPIPSVPLNWAFNAKNFPGVVCNGTNDDTAGLNMALTAFKTALDTAGAGAFLFNGGICKVTGPLNFTGIRTPGALVDGGGVTIYGDYGGGNGAVIDAAYTQDFSIKNLTVLVRGPTALTTQSGSVSGGNTFTVASATGISNGMYLSDPSNPNAVPYATTITISGTTVTTSNSVTTSSGDNLQFFAHCPTNGIQIGRVGTTETDAKIHFDNVFIGANGQSSCFLRGAFYNNASEESIFVKLWAWNNYSNGYSVIQDGWNHWGITSSFQTVTAPTDTDQSFNNNTFISGDWRQGGGGNGLWISGTQGHTYHGYIAAGQYPIVLYQDGSGTTGNSFLTITAHAESTGGYQITDNVLVSGPLIAPRFDRLIFTEFNPQSSNSIFKLDTGVTAASIYNGSINLGILGTATKVFDNPTPWTASLDLNTQIGFSSAWWNLPQSQLSSGRLCFGLTCTNYSQTPNPVLYGDGSDGTVNCTGASTLTHDMNYLNLTLSTGCAINSANFAIRVANLFESAGSPAAAIYNNSAAGPNASGATPGSAPVLAGTNPGTLPSQTLGTITGGTGKTGAGTNGSLSVSTVPWNYNIITAGSGGNGGNSFAGSSGATGIAAQTRSAGNYALSGLPPLWQPNSVTGATPGYATEGLIGGPGAQGGGDAVNLAGGGGSSSYPGGAVAIFALVCDRSNTSASGTIQSKSGNGGNGGNASGTGTSGGGGGGGAGTGGLIFMLCGSLTGTPATGYFDVSGGSGGNGGNGNSTGHGGVGGTGGGTGTVYIRIVGNSPYYARSTASAGTTGGAASGATGGTGGAGATQQVNF